MVAPEFVLNLTMSALIAAAPVSASRNCDVGKGGREMAARVGAVLLDAVNKTDDTETLILIKRINDALPPPGCQ